MNYSNCLHPFSFDYLSIISQTFWSKQYSYYMTKGFLEFWTCPILLSPPGGSPQLISHSAASQYFGWPVAAACWLLAHYSYPAPRGQEPLVITRLSASPVRLCYAAPTDTVGEKRFAHFLSFGGFGSYTHWRAQRRPTAWRVCFSFWQDCTKCVLDTCGEDQLSAPF